MGAIKTATHHPELPRTMAFARRGQAHIGRGHPSGLAPHGVEDADSQSSPHPTTQLSAYRRSKTMRGWSVRGTGFFASRASRTRQWSR